MAVVALIVLWQPEGVNVFLKVGRLQQLSCDELLCTMLDCQSNTAQDSCVQKTKRITQWTAWWVRQPQHISRRSAHLNQHQSNQVTLTNTLQSNPHNCYTNRIHSQPSNTHE